MMATIHRALPGLRHLRSDPTFHVLLYKNGRLRREGRGLSFWYTPLSASIAEVPCDDQDVTFVFHGRSSDFQDVTAQGVITYRVHDPVQLADRLDFSLDGRTGRYRKQPIQQLAELLIQLAQQLTADTFTASPVRELVAHGVEPVRNRILVGLRDDPGLEALGLQIVSVRVSQITPTSDLERALQAPTHEAIQQEADEATFQRRALAVEKERAIQENELQNQIELARREELLITQQGENEQRRAREEAEAKSIEATARAERDRLAAGVTAESHRVVEGARVEAERERMAVYRELPTATLLGLAAQKLAGKLKRIDHLNLSPDTIGPLLTTLMQAGTKRLADGNEAP